MRTSALLLALYAICTLGMPTAAHSQSCLFRSGFEPATTLRQYELNGHPNPKYADLYGTDYTTGYDWEADLDDQPCVGNFRIYYETGDTTRVRASLAPDPLDSNNTVLKFRLYKANVLDVPHPKGRIQAALHQNEQLSAFGWRVRLWLHPDIGLLREYQGTITWFTLMEVWNNLPTQDWPFRISLNVVKPEAAAGSGLFFRLHGQTLGPGGWEDVWAHTDTAHEVPLGQWITLETHFVEGDAAHGRYHLQLIDSLGQVYTLFDLTNYTHHPDDPAPDGVRSFNPMKLYTSATLIDSMAAHDAELSACWDDFEFWRDTLLSSVAAPRVPPASPIQCYPVPFHDVLYVVADGNTVRQVRLLDVNGQPLMKASHLPAAFQVAHLPKGVYLLELQYERGRQAVRLLVKK